MPLIYIKDDLIAQIFVAGKETQKFISEAINEKLLREKLLE